MGSFLTIGISVDVADGTYAEAHIEEVSPVSSEDTEALNEHEGIIPNLQTSDPGSDIPEFIASWET